MVFFAGEFTATTNIGFEKSSCRGRSFLVSDTGQF
jgi:hypothetical protein